MAIIYKSYNNWKVQDTIYPLFKHVLSLFEGIFGQKLMNEASCYVYVDSNCATAPIILSSPMRIVLKASHSCPCAFIFELAHELTHYAIKQRTDNEYVNTCAVAAFEEPACSAMSLYILKLYSERLDDNMLCQNNCRFTTEKSLKKNLENYRKDRYLENEQDSCKTYKEWTSICNRFTGQITSACERPKVGKMRNHLYDSFVQMPDRIIDFIDYPLYLRSIPFDKLIDSDKWKADKPQSAEFIQKICEIQPALA